MPQTTKEQVIENFDKRFVSGMFRTEKQQEMIDFLSSTYDTAYEKGVMDAMERIGEDGTDCYCKHPESSHEYVPEFSSIKSHKGRCAHCECKTYHDSGINQERSRLRLALSELLKRNNE